MLGVKITREPRAPREPRGGRLAWTVAGWNPAITAGIVVLIGLVIHEAVYAIAGGDDYPLELHAGGARVFALSHGGLDALAVGLLAVGVLHFIDFARKHARRPA